MSVELAKKVTETPSGDELADGPDDARAREKKAKPASGVQFAQSMNMDLFEGKEVSKVHLYDNAVINSRLVADDGAMLRQFHLKAQTITYDARTRHLTVPGPGRCWSRRTTGPPATSPSRPPGRAATTLAAFASGNGVTAFQWAQKLEYDEAAGRAVMDGSVVVSHQPDRKGDAPVRIDADTLTATFETQRGSRGPGRESRRDGAARRCERGRGWGHQRRRRRRDEAPDAFDDGPRQHPHLREGSELAAHEISYDPANEWVVARGTPRNPASFTAAARAGTMRAGELWLNTKTWQVKVKDVNTRVGVGGIGR